MPRRADVDLRREKRAGELLRGEAALSLRITTGTLRGRRIPVPRGDVRPTSERARQAFFNIVGDRIDNARFLDLYAGSGIFAFEAVSRGAAEAIAVDEWRPSTQAIEKLAKEWNAPVKTITADAFAGIKRLGSGVFDVIYADPPYAFERHDELLMAIEADVHLAPGATLAIEHRRRSEPFQSEPRKLHFERRAEYGEVWISIWRTNG
ncbi:MAG TPA: RsmD family RNA methyltransferase [Thermoanaerobaculia bacterium]|nr:RsmD family RNA methyltransferase [Thermoanaerobaculia bacterium]